MMDYTKIITSGAAITGPTCLIHSVCPPILDYIISLAGGKLMEKYKSCCYFVVQTKMLIIGLLKF